MIANNPYRAFVDGFARLLTRRRGVRLDGTHRTTRRRWRRARAPR